MKLASFDVETQGSEDLFGLQPGRVLTGKAWLSSAAYAIEVSENEYRTDARLHPNIEWLRKFLTLCAKYRITITTWNGPFDVAWLIAHGLRDEVYACKWLDGLMLWRHNRGCPTFEVTKETMGYGLKEAVNFFLPWAGGYQKGVTFAPETPEQWEQLRTYNADDANHTLTITKILWDTLTPEQQRVARIEAACIPQIAETLVFGVQANKDAAQILSKRLYDDASLAYVKLKMQAPDITQAQLASPKQLADLLHMQWGLPVAKLTDKNAPSTDREALSIMAVADPRASLINDWREAKNNGTKFADGTVKSLAYNDDGVVRPAHRIFGTYTGRMSISASQGRGKARVPTGIPLHQWKRDPDFRGVIEAPEGYDLVEFDFAGQEFRWMAVVSGDPTMLGLCQPGEDAHSFMGSAIAHEEYDEFRKQLKLQGAIYKPKRQLGKVANLSLQYRTSAKTLMRVAAIQHKIKIEFDEAQQIWRTYQQTYPFVKHYWKKQADFVKRNNYIVNPMGRRVWVNQPHAREKRFEWSYKSTAINFPIQSAGADQKYLALLILKDMLPRWGARFYFELHDGLFIIVPKQYTQAALPVLRHALSNLPYRKAFGLDLPIQFPVDAKVGTTWGNLVEIA